VNQKLGSEVKMWKWTWKNTKNMAQGIFKSKKNQSINQSIIQFNSWLKGILFVIQAEVEQLQRNIMRHMYNQLIIQSTN